MFYFKSNKNTLEGNNASYNASNNGSQGAKQIGHMSPFSMVLRSDSW